MDLRTLILAESREFLARRFNCSREFPGLALRPVENPLVEVSRPTQESFLLSGTYPDHREQQNRFQFFVKIARKNEVVAQRLVCRRVKHTAPEIYHWVPLDQQGEVLLTFNEYVEGTDELWVVLNSLRMCDESTQPGNLGHHDFARQLLKMIAQKVAALHHLLSLEWLEKDARDCDFKRVSGEDIDEVFATGLKFMARAEVVNRLNASGIGPGLVKDMEIAREDVRDAILFYPYQALLHGDLQIANVVWNPASPGRIYFVDWEHAFIGPVVLDLFSLQASFKHEDFIDPYLETSRQLRPMMVDRKGLLGSAAAATVYRSLKLVSGSAAVLASLDQTSDSLPGNVQGVLLQRIYHHLALFNRYR